MIILFQSWGSCPGDSPTEWGPMDSEHSRGRESPRLMEWTAQMPSDGGGLQKRRWVCAPLSPEEPCVGLFYRELLESLALTPKISLCSRSITVSGAGLPATRCFTRSFMCSTNDHHICHLAP